LLADSFCTLASSEDQNVELARQAGALAQMTWADLPSSEQASQSRLDGAGLVLYPSNASPLPGVRTTKNLTNSTWLKFSVEAGAVTPGYWAGMAISCPSNASSLLDPEAFALRVFSNGVVSVISQGIEFMTSSVPVSELYTLEIEVSASSFEPGATAHFRAAVNGTRIDLNGSTPGVGFSRPGITANYALLQASKESAENVPAARFRNFNVVDMRPEYEDPGTLLHDTFNTAETGLNVNAQLERQSGLLAPVAYEKVTTDPAGEWRSELTGSGVSIWADNGHLAGVRTETSITNEGRFRIAVRIRPSDFRPHNRFGFGCSRTDIDPTTSGTGIGLMIWRNSGHIFVYDRGKTIYDGFVPVSSTYTAEFDVLTPPEFNGSGTALVELGINGHSIDLNGTSSGTSYSRPGLTVNHIMMMSFIAAEGSRTEYDDLMISRTEVEPLPSLEIGRASGNAVTLAWPASAVYWSLEHSSSPSSTAWSPVDVNAVDDGTTFSTRLTNVLPRAFFRLGRDSANPNLVNDLAEPLVIVPESHVLVTTNGGLWPTLALLSNGEVLAFGHNSPGHTTLPGDEDCWASADGGKSWSRRATAARRPFANANYADACVGIASDDHLVMMTAGYNDPGGSKRILGMPAIFRSADNGFTWKQQGLVPNILPGGEITRPYGQIVPAADGSLRTVVYDQTLSGRAYVLTSRDNGLTWREPARIGSDINETVTIELRPGRWLAIGRTISKPAPVNGQELRQFRSFDDGRTWTDEGLVAGYSKHPPKLTRLKDGRLLLSYCNRRNGSIEVRFSSNEGKIWSQPYRIAMTGGDRGYPDSTPLPDGKIVTVYYAQSSYLYSGYHMGAAVWTPPRIGLAETGGL
jgi:hypothetical protein